MTNRAGKPDTPSDITIRKAIDAKPPTSFNMIAGAGSGKTTSLVKALQHIGGTQGQTLRRNNQKVACITYTEVATKEIWGDVGNDPLFHVSTIHSFLWELSKPFQRDIKNWVKEHVVSKLEGLKAKRDNFGPRVQQRTKDKNLRDITKYENVVSAIDSVKSFKYRTGSDYTNGVLGHADILKLAPALINTQPLFRKVIAHKYPFFFVDESQDTVPDIIEALRAIHKQENDIFCLGFFGDPMQKIYVTGVGSIEQDPSWDFISKPENFRSPTRVLSLINNIRSEADKLQQVAGEKFNEDGTPASIEGTARIFVLPADENREAHIKLIRSWLATNNQDQLWDSDDKEADIKVLVLVHRMAAKRLNFADLYAAFNDGAPGSFSTAFNEDTHWALKPFRVYLLPLVEAFNRDDKFSVIQLLREHCPLLAKDNIVKTEDQSKLLSSINDKVKALVQLLTDNKVSTVQEVLEYVEKAKLFDLDERFKTASISEEDVDPAEIEKRQNSLDAYYNCPAEQLWGYNSYMKDESPYDTHQGIKGAEFKRVMVVLDDEEGSAHNQFSYEKLLKLKALSATDIKNQEQNIDSAVERTRRLFYVCCSRALKDLAVVLFTQDVSKAISTIKEDSIFESDSILSLNELLDS